ncbi:Ribonuclease BN, tRNA processing enzyme [Arthrobacter sp. yr096]|uniref:MBL fold metallo-hydrolase n=1 Tax=Arthrobacter sp. yr096 TaxID=1761750 RepID=UPI0008CEA4E2|nr:MBL fold metallo-hydrolase [Arthrobacter sp. yr096]SEI94343.1 Ribonuclease BN, tRNA processing enzyme [Arthrobacter sp. yr096]
MCDVISQFSGVSRRSLLGLAGVAGGAALVSSMTAPAVAAGDYMKDLGNARDYHTRLALLGTAAGRTFWGGTERQGISSALAVGDAVYLIDCGDGWARRYLQAGLGTQKEFSGLEGLEGVFITHMHSDHLIDYPSLLIFGSTDGLAVRKKPVQVFGPGSRGKLVPLSPSATDTPPVINPENPTPGISDMTEYVYQAYAADLNDNMRDSLKPDPHTLINVSEVVVPPGLVVNPDVDPAPPMEPLHVYEDENVRVTATLVKHPPVYPALAYRFDTAEGSVVFSGDTAYSDNLIRLAQGADILVHEVIDPRWVESLFPSPPTPAQEAKIHHLINSHTSIEEVGVVAENAGVKTLVLSHLAPADNPKNRWLEAGRSFSGRLVVGDDLMQIGIGKRRR